MPDGSKIVTYNGFPLYYYYEDKQQGDVKGFDIPKWFVLTPEGKQLVKQTKMTEEKKSESLPIVKQEPGISFDSPGTHLVKKKPAPIMSTSVTQPIKKEVTSSDKGKEEMTTKLLPNFPEIEYLMNFFEWAEAVTKSFKETKTLSKDAAFYKNFDTYVRYFVTYKQRLWRNAESIFR